MTTTVLTKDQTLLTDVDRCDDHCTELAAHRYRSEETGNSLDLCFMHSHARGPVLDEMEWRIVAWRR